MRLTRIIATLVIAFLFGGGSAEIFLKAKGAIDRRAAPQEGSAGELVSLELQDATGQLIARPRVVVSAGRTVDLVLRNPERPDEIRVALRLQAERQASGDLLIGYRISLPLHEVEASGTVNITPGVEQVLDLGEHAIGATLFTIPVPSAAFDAYLDFERARNAITSI